MSDASALVHQRQGDPPGIEIDGEQLLEQQARLAQLPRLRAGEQGRELVPEGQQAGGFEPDDPRAPPG